MAADDDDGGGGGRERTTEGALRTEGRDRVARRDEGGREAGEVTKVEEEA